MLLSVCPRLPMRDKDVTKEFYINQLDFHLMRDYSDYFIIMKDDIELHFFEYKELNIADNYGQVYIRVKEIENIYKIFLAKNVIHPKGHIATKPWGQKEFSVRDPDNNLLTFGENPN